MLFSEELQVLERSQLIHPLRLPGSSASFPSVALREVGGNRKVMDDSPTRQDVRLALLPQEPVVGSVAWAEGALQLHRRETEAWNGSQQNGQRGATCGSASPTSCTDGHSFLFGLRVWSEEPAR